ncbi:hypothetical protein Poli38472_007731 [Pythium oligandrum]|uniref:Metalloendopeptidase n=1 Tax=Pythium oligandrum TaxID=41045 RepID=A0A8K1CRR9_PYTOL|nr:hypothetical protein Poli38472_007731 [Pythium oligandrum]|eukprot:TMW68059.1 hypothetical protein Poli38472_007731 [Pythium oligandrum]
MRDPRRLFTFSSVLGACVSPQAASSACSVGGVQFNGLAHYLVGRHRLPRSIYADCIDDKPTCYVDDGISDTTDRQVPCDDVVIETRRRELGVLVEESRTWPYRVVCLSWVDNFSEHSNERWARAFKEFQARVGITFISINNCRRIYGQNTKVCNNCQTSVRMMNSQPGFYASLGYYPGNYDPELNIGDGQAAYKVYLHELGHVVGLYHEHAHPQRQAIVLRDKLRVSSSEYAKEQRAHTLRYDVTSVMHYNSEALCLPRDTSLKFCDVTETEENNCVVPKEEHCDRSEQDLLGRSAQLSSHDVNAIRTLYDDEPRHSRSPGKLRAKPESDENAPSPNEAQAQEDDWRDY